mmetsp:Transcript_10910/g.19271  ORF Transcript_10910/g.19271 Transcript_10910/m.19271 type:complete len:1080 (+) Transcript_10910:403-3642(+)|eukprot:CAMPEP_0184525802 /NCGR_PEP_ID=MMETSP0198_2-20121128/10307_1 /TAXON_ID=1112570 /ORGANISM="Thraustochytrium sp., Strain LLF1b" /LENGTH=1079 /DNA_ID=CAMNT_0026917315 /DNA_START=254 /DNA_END=3493 /DNA_ORIENTATION=+
MGTDDNTAVEPFLVGDVVTVQGKKRGVIRYVGHTGFKTGEWIGVELEQPVGRNNGTVGDRTYFTCEPNHGIFIEPKYVKRFEEEDVAAVTLQSNFRTMLAKKKVKARQAARTWNVLDNHYEEESMRKGKSFDKATKQLKASTVVNQNMVDEHEKQLAVASAMEDLAAVEAAEAVATRARGDSEVSEESLDGDLFMGATVEELQQAAADAVQELTEDMLSVINPADSYEGVHLKFPLTLENTIEMLEAFKTDKILHFKYFMLLLLNAKKIFEKECTLQDITITEGIKLTVVGDTHGQLQDLFTIFTINGVPSEKNWYLFNGDFVDRGSKGCEVFACMIAFKILYPKSVFLNRGNHEARAQNAWMGFEEELLTKYGHDASAVAMKPSTRSFVSPAKKARRASVDRMTGMKYRMNVFGPGDRLASLKLYMLVQATFDSLPLCALIQERVFVCHGGLFRNDGVKLDHIRALDRKREPPLEGSSLEDRIYEDLLWSDPRPSATYPRPLKNKRPSDRGAGCEFGPLVTNKFCATNQIALVVRSHECVSEGFEVLHNGRLITIFSASRYCGTQTNKGAFIGFGPDLQPEIQQFYAHAVEKGSFMSDEERETMLERDAVKMIIENICDKRLDLYWYFTQHDKKHTGRCSRVDWANALCNVLGLDLPFLHYQSHLAEPEDDGSINYTKFLSRFQIVSHQEDSLWQESIVQRICEKLFSLVGANLEEAYQKFDANEDGQIEYEEFVKTLHSLNVGLTDQQMYELMRSVDVDDDAHINFKEFAERFALTFAEVSKAQGSADGNVDAMEVSESASLATRPHRTASMQELEDATKRAMPDRPISPRNAHNMKLDWSKMDSWTLSKLTAIGRAIFTKTDTLRDAWEGFDSSKKGYIEAPDFFTAVSQYIGMDISEKDSVKLFKAIDTNNSGKINVLEFFDAFRADDRNPKAKIWKQGIVQQISNCLYQHRIHLRAAFRMFDVDGNGLITSKEFSDGMNSINELLDKPLTPQQIDELRRSLDRDGNGTIDYKEFFQSFSIEDTTASHKGLLRSGSSYMDINDVPVLLEPSKRAALETIKKKAERSGDGMEMDES